MGIGVRMPHGCSGFVWDGGLEKGETSLEAEGSSRGSRWADPGGAHGSVGEFQLQGFRGSGLGGSVWEGLGWFWVLLWALGSWWDRGAHGGVDEQELRGNAESSPISVVPIRSGLFLEGQRQWECVGWGLGMLFLKEGDGHNFTMTFIHCDLHPPRPASIIIFIHLHLLLPSPSSIIFIHHHLHLPSPSCIIIFIHHLHPSLSSSTVTFIHHNLHPSSSSSIIIFIHCQSAADAPQNLDF